MGNKTSLDFFVGRAEVPAVLSGSEELATELRWWQPEVGDSLEEVPLSSCTLP